MDVVKENTFEHIEWCQQNSELGGVKSPLEGKYGKRKHLKNVIGVLGKSQTNIYSNKVNTQLGKIQKTGRIFLCVFLFTLISPLYLNRATLIRKMQWLSTLLLPSKQTHHRNPYLQYSPLLGARLETGVHFTYFWAWTEEQLEWLITATGGLDIYGARARE